MFLWNVGNIIHIPMVLTSKSRININTELPWNHKALLTHTTDWSLLFKSDKLHIYLQTLDNITDLCKYTFLSNSLIFFQSDPYCLPNIRYENVAKLKCVGTSVEMKLKEYTWGMHIS
jgi:hypothetical protein